MNITAESWEQLLRSVKVEDTRGGSELRSNPRVGIRARLSIIPLVNGVRGRPIAVWTRDISVDGLGFINTEPMQPRSEFLFELERKQGAGVPLRFLCTVHSCREVGGDLYCIGTSCKQLNPNEKIALAATDGNGKSLMANASISKNTESVEAERIRKAVLG
jgi:hypothetical protein